MAPAEVRPLHLAVAERMAATIPFQFMRQPPTGRFHGRSGGGMERKELERKDRPEFGSVILPFVGPNSFNCV